MMARDIFEIYEERALQDEEDRKYARLRRVRREDFGFSSIGGAMISGFSRMASSYVGDGCPEIELERAIEQLPVELHDQARGQYERGLPKCESPIERRIFPWLLCQTYSCFDQNPCVLFAGETDSLKPFTVAVVPQLEIGKRRADFALAARRNGPVRFVIVECDGAEYHKDVHRDVQRDADLMRYNRVLDVYPITGSEIHNDPKKAAHLASKALTHAWAKTNDQTKAKFGLEKP